MITETSVYGGRAKVLFDSDTHDYTIKAGDQTYRHPSVTTVLKALGGKGDVLLQWAINQMANKMLELGAAMGQSGMDTAALAGMVEVARDQWRDTRDNAGTIGTHVHAILEGELKNTPMGWPELAEANKWMLAPVKLAVGAGKEFFANHHLEVLETEGVRWSPTHGFIGTSDVIARVDGKLSVLDFKTGKGIYPEAYAQTAAYALAYEEEHPGEVIEERWIIRVGKTGKLETKTRFASHHEGDTGVFLNVLGSWRWLESLKRSQSFSGPANPLE